MINSINTKLSSFLIESKTTNASKKGINKFLKKEMRTELPTVPSELNSVIIFKDNKIPIPGTEKGGDKNNKLALLSILMLNRK